MTKTAAIVGGGVIGGGWAARFLLMGWDVRVFDPDPQSERKIGEVLANARRSLPGLYEVALPAEGRLSHHPTIAEAVAGAGWVVESVPERLDVKHRVYREIQGAAPGVVIGSSTSGFKPSELQEGAADPSTILVTHPFNPVYLLPLAELVPSPKNPPAVIDRARAVLAGIGMHPLHVRAEIDAHIADRFLEAVWREALWLIRDGIATTEEIDDAIRYGFGLRWAQMGLFETYRIAGGEAGMRHFIAQFGPCLSWPWTKLMDVPELTEELTNRIADQSDAQSGRYSIRELERIRDNNLVGILRSLKGKSAINPAAWGGGALLRAQDRALAGPPPDVMAPFETLRRAVPLDWTDYNGHMNEANFLTAFADATDRFMELVGMDGDYVAAGSSLFTAETHIRHLGEVKAGDVIGITTRLLAAEGRKVHLWHEMRVGGDPVATGEHLLVHTDLATRRATPPGPAVAERLAKIAGAHARLPRPGAAGRFVGQPRQ
ncbi:MAG: carnitine 3-dehydrogenase [Paracoccaceae bacterium]